MSEKNFNVIRNPVLKLLKEPSPSTPSGGGKNEKGISKARLNKQRKSLSGSFSRMTSNGISSKSGVTQLLVKMFEDSHAPSWTPTDLFNGKESFEVIFPAYEGYLIEGKQTELLNIAKRIKESDNIKDKVDISRIKEVKIFDQEDALRGRNLDQIWNNDDNNEYQNFVFWLLPYKSVVARSEVIQGLRELLSENDVSFGDQKYDNPFGDQKEDELAIDRIATSYEKKGKSTFSVRIKNKNVLNKLVCSGAVYRVEPVSYIKTNDSPPGSGTEPNPNMIDGADLPTVVVIDGGHDAKSYKSLETTEFPPLVPLYEADIKHGNQVISIVCNGHAWNNNLNLPQLDCRFLSAQAITKEGVKSQPTTHQFLNYLDRLAEESKEISSVWNLSFNEVGNKNNQLEVSHLGHEISKIARRHNILPVISIGNASAKNKSSIAPPADCEAALTVSGRLAEDGAPGTPCSISLKGPGPAGMLKPDLSWFSKLRMIGGVINTGTSYSAPLVASLAAHTFCKIKDPTPDLVKALLINRSEMEQHDHSLGWGTPWSNEILPWECDSDSVTLAWTSKLKVGFRYYWNEIPIPNCMMEGDKFVGEVIFTSILKPITSDTLGVNYFSTRLETSLRANSLSGKTINLLTKQKKNPSHNAEFIKWCPTKNQRKNVSSKLSSRKMSLYARIYARDLYQYELSNHHELDEQEVSFVLTLRKKDAGEELYNSMIRDLGNEVEPGINVDFDVDII